MDIRRRCGCVAAGNEYPPRLESLSYPTFYCDVGMITDGVDGRIVL